MCLTICNAGGVMLKWIIQWTFKGNLEALFDFIRKLILESDENKYVDIKFLKQIIEKKDLDDFNFFSLLTLMNYLTEFGHLKNDLKSVETELSKVRTYRNFVLYGEKRLQDEELKEEIRLLKETYTSLIVKVGQQFKPSETAINDLIKIVQGQMHTEIDIVKEEAEEFNAEVNTYKEGVFSSLKNRIRKELKDVYKEMCQIKLPLCDKSKTFIPVADIYTNFSLKSRDCERKLQDKDIMTTCLENSKLPDIIIVTGDPSMGKTTLLKNIIDQWQNNKTCFKGLYDVDMIFLIDNGNVHSKTFNGLVEYFLPNLLKFYKMHGEQEFFLQTISLLNTLILIDELDNVNDQTNIFLNDILSPSFKSCRYLFTAQSCIPDYIVGALNQSDKSKLYLDLEDVVSRNNLRLMHNVTTTMREYSIAKESREKATVYFFVKKNVHREFYSPFFITSIANLAIENPEALNVDQTITSVFYKLEDIIVSNLAHNISCSVGEDFDKINIECKIRKILCIIEKIAFSCSVRNNLVLSDENIKSIENLCKDSEIPKKELMNGFLKQRSTTIHPNDEYCYSFYSKIFQEFYSAKYIHHVLINGDSNIWNTLFEDEDLKAMDAYNLLIFITEMLIKSNAFYIHKDTVIRLAKRFGFNNQNHWLQLLSNIPDKSKISSIIAQIFVHNNWFNWIILDSGVDALLSLLDHITPKKVHLLICDVNNSPVINQSLKKVVQEMSIKQIELKLDFPYFYVNHNCGTADELLHPILQEADNSCTLTKLQANLSCSQICELKSSLETLILQVNIDQLTTLSAHLPKLINLRLLGKKQSL